MFAGDFLEKMYTENTENFKKCCFTGYRPDKLPFDFNIKNKSYYDFENLVTNGILKLADENCRVFYTGMAMGFDILCAENVLLLKEVYKEPFKLVCAIPFKNQPDFFSEYWKEKYNSILKKCDEIVILSDRYYRGCYQKRNRFMVDKSDYVLTWFDGKSGGTKNTVEYALKKNKFVFNLKQDTITNRDIQTVFQIF